MNETPQKKIVGRPFQKGNKAASVPDRKKPYIQRTKEFMEEDGWDILEKWAMSRNWKASLAAVTTILAYAHGKPREQIKLEGSSFNVQQWFLQFRTGSGFTGAVPINGPEQPRMVLPGGVGDNGVGKTNGHSSKHSGQA